MIRIPASRPAPVLAAGSSFPRPNWTTVLRVVLALGLLVPLVGCGGDPGRYSIGARQYKKDARRPDAKKADDKAADREHNTEAYAHIAENPFLRAVVNPLSTFSIDVDTASYSNVRRFLLEEHRLPPADAVRVEELINYFPYAYRPAAGDHPVAFTLELGECPWNANHRLARIGLAAQKLDPGQMPPRNLDFLVDTSGSMNSPNRLPLLQASLRMLVEQLTPRDRVAIVAYAGSAGLVLDSTPGDNKPAILDALDRLRAGGSTNGGQGIQLAYRVAEANFIRGGVNRVILGTDGDFNVGVTSQGELVRLIEAKRKGGVFLTILGFGMGNLKDSTLEQLAHHGNGHYAYIDSQREAHKVFVEQGSALVTVAKDVKLQVEFNPKLVGAYRLIGYENRLLRNQDFNDDRKDAGDLGSGHTVTALYEIVPAGLPVPGPGVDPLKYQQPATPSAAADSDEWLTVKLRYKETDGEVSKLLSQVVAGPPARLAATSADFRFAAAVASFGMLLRDSAHKGDCNYASVRRLAQSAQGADPGGHRAGLLELIDAAERLGGGKR